MNGRERKKEGRKREAVESGVMGDDQTTVNNMRRSVSSLDMWKTHA